MKKKILNILAWIAICLAIGAGALFFYNAVDSNPQQNTGWGIAKDSPLR